MAKILTAEYRSYERKNQTLDKAVNRIMGPNVFSLDKIYGTADFLFTLNQLV